MCRFVFLLDGVLFHSTVSGFNQLCLTLLNGELKCDRVSVAGGTRRFLAVFNAGFWVHSTVSGFIERFLAI